MKTIYSITGCSKLVPTLIHQQFVEKGKPSWGMYNRWIYNPAKRTIHLCTISYRAGFFVDSIIFIDG